MDRYLNDDEKTAQFEALVMPHLDAAYNLARWLTRDAHDAEDLVQNACLRAFRFADSYRGGNARAWLLTIVRHTYFSTVREAGGRRADVAFDEALHGGADLPAGPPSGGAGDPALAADSRDAARSVDRALASLPAIFREVLVMKELDELSYKEIAEVTDLPIGTVMSRLARARKLLLACLTSPGEPS
jgi:RNA polymerase sigma-70 factor (ECF subfamily)